MIIYLKNKINIYILNKKKTIYKLNILNYLILYIYDTLSYLKNIIYLKLNYNTNKNLLKTKELSNLFVNNKVFVFGLGPSLSEIDFKKVLNYQKNFDYKVFCINSYANTTKSRIVIPDFYLLSDPAYFEECLTVSVERKEQLLKDIEYLVLFNITTFVPIKYYKIAKNMNLRVYAFNDFEYKWGKTNINPLYPRSYLSMTVYKALACANYMGFEKIYISGIDNDYFKSLEVSVDNKVSFCNNHAEKQVDSTKVFVDKNIAEILYNDSYLFFDLHQFPYNKIINLHSESLVDVFEKNNDLDIKYKEF